MEPCLLASCSVSRPDEKPEGLLTPVPFLQMCTGPCLLGTRRPRHSSASPRLQGLGDHPVPDHEHWFAEAKAGGARRGAAGSNGAGANLGLLTDASLARTIARSIALMLRGQVNEDLLCAVVKAYPHGTPSIGHLQQAIDLLDRKHKIVNAKCSDWSFGQAGRLHELLGA